jgi:outer membrane protein assembly factor BamD
MKAANKNRLCPSLLLGALLGLGGCATEGLDTSKWPPEKLYAEAQAAMKGGDYEEAIKYFETLEAQYPFGSYAEQAELDTAYAYYKFDEADSAISAADRFIKLHPRHQNVDYAYYLRGLASESKKGNPLDVILPQDSSLRDPSSERQAFDYFAELVKKFPDSRYARDAVKRMARLRNSLSLHEIHVARYYLDRGAYVAAVNRAKYVVENFSDTPAARTALGIMVSGYKGLKMDQLAQDAQRVLELNRTED